MPNIDRFYENYLFPFSVDGVSLEDVESIQAMYLAKMKKCNSLSEMREVAAKFKWLAFDSSYILDMVNESAVERIKYLLNNTKSIPPGALAPIILPHVMLMAYLIAKDRTMPEYPAAFQYVVATRFAHSKREEKEGEHYTICHKEQESKWGLHDATPGCEGKVRSARGGGIKCDTCNGWFCF
jgi:hypothetical protein